MKNGYNENGFKVSNKKKYIKYTKKNYEFNFMTWRKQHKIGEFFDTQPDLIRNGYPVNEVVYVVRTHRRDLNILIYTSIDVRNEKVRTKGSDAVRVVLVWKNKNTGKRYYRKVKKHLRITTLFDNLENTITSTLKYLKSPEFNFHDFKEGIGLEYN